MNEQLTVAIVAGLLIILNSVVVVSLPVLYKRIGIVKEEVRTVRSDVKETKEQVVNDHGDRNFRDENDSRHAETLNLFDQQNQKFDTIIKTQSDHEDLLGYLITGYVENREDIDELERTYNPKDNNNE